MAALIKIRRDTSANWASNDPTLAQGELGLDTDTGVIKVGNGSDVWSDLLSIGVYNSNDRISKTVDTDTGSLIVDEFGKLYFDRGGTITFDDTGNLFAGTGNSNFKISLDDHTGDVTEYNFGHDGNLTLPAGATIGDLYGDSSTTLSAAPGSDVYIANNNGQQWIGPEGDGVYIGTDYTGNNHQWNFNTNGSLLLPDDGVIGDWYGFTTLSNTAGAAIATSPGNAVVVNPTDGTWIYADNKEYIFGANATVQLPGNIQLDSSSVIKGAASSTGAEKYIEAIDFSVTDHTVIMITSHGFVNSDKIYINNIGPGSTEELTDTYCYVMVIDPDNFEIYSDKELTMPIWADNYTTFVYSGEQPLNGTVVRIYDAGSVNISTTIPQANHDAGQINLNVSNNIWHFGPDGNLTFPNGDLTIGHDPYGDPAIIGAAGKNIGLVSSGVGEMGDEIGSSLIWVDSITEPTKIAAVTANNPLYVGAGDVGIVTGDYGPDLGFSNIWNFGVDGNLTLPANGYILNSDLTVYGGTGGAGGGISITDFGEGFSLTASNKVVTNKLYSTNLTEPTQHYRLEVDTNGVVVLPDQSIINGSVLRGVYGTGEANYTGITIGPDADHREESWVWVDHTGVSIATEYSTSAHTWKFDNDGKLTTPSFWRVGNDTSNTSVSNDGFANLNDLWLRAGDSLFITTDINTGNSDSQWIFGNGLIQLPDFGAITSPNYGFSFNKDSGKTGVPELGTDVTFATESLDSDILDGQVYMGSGYGEFRSIYNKVDSTESGLVYAGVEGFNYAQYGDVNFAGMVSQTPNIDSMYALSLNEQGQITIGFTQDGQTQTSNDWSVVVGTLNTDYTVNGLFANTNVTVIGSGLSSWTFGDDGNLTLPTGGEIHSAAGVGNVVVNTNDGANSYAWTFETNGNITFPDSTTQSTAYKRTTGSWTVATGSGSYSFTVPGNATYTMWVRGNIPDGIIVWNATATVTNSNVPVIGQQYAWNYTGGGTPIEITAIPAQFIGTGNVIVSSNPSVGSNSNVFNFTINNSSGSAKTVYWGYVTQ